MRIAYHEPPPHLSQSPTWTWCAEWPGRFYESGAVYDKQVAADCATEAWWKLVADADDRDEALRPARAFMARLIETGEYDLAAIDVGGMVYADLMAIMDEVVRRWRGDTTYPQTKYREQFECLIGELSAEFHRRRTA